MLHVQMLTTLQVANFSEQSEHGNHQNIHHQEVFFLQFKSHKYTTNILK